MFDVILSPDAQEFFASAAKPLASKLSRCFTQLERDPRRHANIRMLTGDLAGRRRYRVGDWRVVFTIDELHSRVLVLTIAHRREVYE